MSENTTSQEVQLVEELAVLIDDLLAAGIRVLAYTERTPRKLTWLILEKDGNTGGIQYQRLGGYGVHFNIRPSRETGSALGVMRPDGEEPQTREEVLAAAELAVGARYGNFATPGYTLPNDGIRHYGWATASLVEITSGSPLTAQLIDPKA